MIFFKGLVHPNITTTMSSLPCQSSMHVHDNTTHECGAADAEITIETRCAAACLRSVEYTCLRGTVLNMHHNC